MRKLAAALTVLGLTAGAQAQVAPGLRLPQNLSEGVLMAQLMSCTSAASGRVSEGLTMDLSSGLQSVSLQKSLPADLAAAAGEFGPRSRFMTLDTPEGPTWMAFDPVAFRCVVMARASDPEAVRTKILSLYESERSPWERIRSGARPTYKWTVRATPALGTPAMDLLATLNIPSEPKQILVLETVGKKRD